MSRIASNGHPKRPTPKFKKVPVSRSRDLVNLAHILAFRFGSQAAAARSNSGFRFYPKSSRGLDSERAAKVLKAYPHLPGAFDFTNAAIASVSGGVALGGV